MSLKVKKRICVSNGFTGLMAFTLIINPLSHFLYNVLGIGNIYYVSYICWLLLLLGGTVLTNVTLSKTRLILLVLIMLNFIIGAYFGETYFKSGIAEIHTAAMVCVAISFSICISSKVYLSERNITFLLRILVIMGVVSCFYAMVVQKEYLFSLLRGENIYFNSWKYVSFFRQRNIFAEYCFISSIAGCYLYLKTKRVLYLFSVVLFGVQIFLTNSRAALLGFIILLGLSVYLTRRNKIFIVFFCILVFIASWYTFDGYGLLIGRYYHATSSGIDSIEVRVNMWMDMLQYLSQRSTFISGFGMGATTSFLSPVYGVGSSHNAYLDALFNGGIIYLFATIYAIVFGFKEILKNADPYFKIVFISAMIAFCVYCLFEAGMSLFDANYFSVTVTLLLIVIPRYYRCSTLIDNNNT